MTNRTIPATEAKTEFAKLIDTARMEPVTVTRNRRAIAVVMSPEEYERLSSLDDAYWGKRAEEAAKGPFLGEKKSAAFLQSILNEED